MYRSLLIFLWLCTCCVAAQNDFRVMFYNVENLFDNKHDTLKNDNEFLPFGDRHWTYAKYQDKLKNIAKVILVAEGWRNPDIVGLCEIENKRVVNDLIYRSSLKELKYKAVHKESNDRRGIDVALLYNPTSFKLLSTRFYPHPQINSRDILHVKGLIHESDTIHVFVNHWPSRYGGAVKSDPLRIASAKFLRAKVDSIMGINQLANILIMGDFNDYPEDVSLYEVLKARENGTLVNLALLSKKQGGSYKHYGRWDFLDQIIVSESLFLAKSGWGINPAEQKVLKMPFLLEEDQKYTGFKPKRSWIGFKYQSGFSDHLPVLVHLQKH